MGNVVSIERVEDSGLRKGRRNPGQKWFLYFV
jgi:hypothetical protein